MEFQRIGENIVQCRMSLEELNEYGLEMEDFFTNKEKARDFLESLVQRAEEEVDYEVETGMVSMQLMRTPDDALVVTFSDRGEDALQNMLHQIQSLAGMGDLMDQDSEMLSELGASLEDMANEEAAQEGDDQDSAGRDLKEEYRQHMKEVEKRKLKKERQEIIAAKVFCFRTLDLVERFVGSLQLQKNISSKLYRDNKTGLWYLLVKKGKLKFEEYKGLCEYIQEFATLCSQQPFVEQYCKEHYQCVIARQAICAIRDYIS